MAATGNLLKPTRFDGEAGELLVVMDRFMVEEGKPLD